MAATTDWAGAPAVLRMILGKQLQALRRRAGLSYDQAAEALDASHSTIRRIEAAKVARLRAPVVEKLLRTYGVSDPAEIAAFLETVREANQPGWWHSYREVMPTWGAAYLSLEQASRQIRAYEAQVVHELLQTEAYARAQIAAEGPHLPPALVERRLALRMRRQELLRRPDPPRVWVVLDEAALRRPVGGDGVMAEQMAHLVALNELPHVTVQVLRFDRGSHPAMRIGAFHHFRLRSPELPDVVYHATPTGAGYLDAPEDVLVCRETLDRLSAQAAPGRRTAALLAEIRQEL